MTRLLCVLALAVLLAGAFPAVSGAIASPNMWLDFNTDNDLATIERASPNSSDSVSVILDLTGASLSPPFTMTLNLDRNSYCLPNTTDECAGTTYELLPGPFPAEVDSIWLTLTSLPCQDVVYQVGARYKAVPASGPHTVLKLLLTYPTEGTICASSKDTNYSSANVGGLFIGNAFTIKIKSSKLAAAPTTWGRLRRSYR